MAVFFIMEKIEQDKPGKKSNYYSLLIILPKKGIKLPILLDL
jgi:hypothetical protein